MDARRIPALPRHARGISLVEIMVGLVIGMIAVAVIFQVFAASEGFKRNTTSTGDAQQNGLFSTFTLALELANAGNGLALSAQDLATCPNTNDVKTILRPVPVFINAGADDASPDSFVVIYSVANTVVYPALFTANAPAGSPYQIQSPNGFAKDDMIVAISGGGQCAQSKVTAVSAPDLATGIVTITHTGAAVNFTSEALLFNMGPWNRAQRVQYDVQGGVLRSLDLVDANAVPQPIASNIVNMKVQYGIDTDNDGFLNTWTAADAAPWDAASLMGAPLPVINRIKAIRIGLVVRGTQFDQSIKDDTDWVLFDCEDPDKAKCVGRLTGTIKADPAGGAYRYRTYETIVPLRNHLWNRQL